MVILVELRRRARQIAFPVIAASLLGYFLYHAVQGDRGLIAWMVLSQKIDKAKATLAELSAERATLERRVDLLRPQSLDPDLLEERARLVLDFSHPNDLVILLGPDDKAP